MRIKYGYLLVAVICVIGVVVFLLYEKEPEYNIERTLKYSFTVTNPTNKFVKESSMWVYVPVKQTSTQIFISVEASHDYQLVEDGLGNQKLNFDLRDIAPYGSKIVSIKVRVNMSEQPNNANVNDLALYLKSEKYIESENETIVTLASELQRSDEVATTEAIYSWVVENMEYKGFVSEDRGALFALEHGEGDCTEYAYLVTALARALDMPSRSIAGFAYSENARVAAKDYHNWSEVMFYKKWWLVDAQKEVIMEKFADYIAMRIISTGENGISKNSQKYFHIDAPLTAVMH